MFWSSDARVYAARDSSDKKAQSWRSTAEIVAKIPAFRMLCFVRVLNFSRVMNAKNILDLLVFRYIFYAKCTYINGREEKKCFLTNCLLFHKRCLDSVLKKRRYNEFELF